MSKGKKVIFIIGTIVVLLLILIGFGYIKYTNYIKAMAFNENPEFWENKIEKIEKRYNDEYPENVVVFIGSSSIVKWETLKHDMAPLEVVNHGFGGSKVADATYYAGRLIYPFKPKAIVLYSGSNDINGISENSKTGEEVFESTADFFETVHAQLPNVPIYYLPISPNTARWEVWNDSDTANELIKKYCENNIYVTFIDTRESLLNDKGFPEEDLLSNDGLHFNEKGYETWTAIIKPILLKDLE
jgi:lysophospholipase L1-like esterase